MIQFVEHWLRFLFNPSEEKLVRFYILHFSAKTQNSEPREARSIIRCIWKFYVVTRIKLNWFWDIKSDKVEIYARENNGRKILSL